MGKSQREARNVANTQNTCGECPRACCGRATHLILSFRVATQRGKMITFKIQSVHMTKINQEQHSSLWWWEQRYFYSGLSLMTENALIQELRRDGESGPCMLGLRSPWVRHRGRLLEGYKHGHKMVCAFGEFTVLRTKCIGIWMFYDTRTTCQVPLDGEEKWILPKPYGNLHQVGGLLVFMF